MQVSVNSSTPIPLKTPDTSAKDTLNPKPARLSFAYEAAARLYVKRRIAPLTNEVLDQYPTPAFVAAKANLHLTSGSIIDLIV